ncbi:MAG: hypothetical protein ACTSRP_13900 [Candidatus Helarchaeota archaeon]
MTQIEDIEDLLISRDSKISCDKKCENRECILYKHYKALFNRDLLEHNLGYASEEICKLALKNQTSKKRKNLINEVEQLLNKVNRDEFLYIQGKNSILITAPHATWHFRYASSKLKRKVGDWLKIADMNTGILACSLAQRTESNLLVQIYTAWLDPNFYREAFLRKKLREILKNNNIKFILDIHGLSQDRNADFDIIDMYGLSLIPFNLIKIREKLKDRLEASDCDAGINRFFNGAVNSPIHHTIIKEVSQEFHTPCIELEVGRRFRSDPNEIVNKKILEILEKWLKIDVLPSLGA